MAYKTLYLCRHRNRQDARCRNLPRCGSCVRVLRSFSFSDLCPACLAEQQRRRLKIEGAK